MSNATLIIEIGLGSLVIFYFVIAFFSAKTWKVAHVILTVFIFFGAIVYLGLAAMTLRTHEAWRTRYNELVVAVETEQALEAELRRGKENEVQQTTDSIRSVKAELGRVRLDRGRVWAACNPTQVAQDSVTLSIGPEVPEGQQPAHHNIFEKMVLFGFLEGDWEGGWRVPRAYLGQFRVTGVTGSSVTLSPMIPLTQGQTAQLDQDTWVLYETMPIDSHEAFASLDEDELTKYFANAGVATEQPSALFAEYLHDGETADPDRDPAERIWKRVKFKAVHKMSVDSDTAPVALAETAYNVMGHAEPVKLRQGEETEFVIGDEGFFDAQTADKLIAQGLCELKEVVYVRQLRDYGAYFSHIHNQILMSQDVAIVIARDTVVLEDSGIAAAAQLKLCTDDTNWLKEDLAGYQKEQNAVAKYLGQLQSQYAQLRANVSELFASNNQLAAELEVLQEQAAQAIRQRAGQDVVQNEP